MKTNKEILEIAMKQSAIDAHCDFLDFTSFENKVVISKEHKDARRYLQLPFDVQLISYGSNIVASVNEKHKELVTNYINTYSIEHCFETPNLYVLNDALEKDGLRVCFMAEYFLPDVNVLKPLPCDYELKVLNREDFTHLYTKEWSNALCKDRSHLDILGVGAYHNNQLIGLAGCSMDCDDMWQIGVDVLPEYRNQGIASALTSHLALEILKRDKVPFYCCAWSNVKSARNAIKSGFKPAWVEMTAKPIEFINKINNPSTK